MTTTELIEKARREVAREYREELRKLAALEVTGPDDEEEAA